MSVKYIITKGKNLKDPEKVVYQGRFKQMDHPDQVDFAQLISDQCSATASDVRAVIDNLIFCIRYLLIDGRVVRLGDFGSFRTAISAKPVNTKEDWKPSMIRGLKIIFTPGEQFRTALAGVHFQSDGKSASLEEAIPEPEV